MLHFRLPGMSCTVQNGHFLVDWQLVQPQNHLTIFAAVLRVCWYPVPEFKSCCVWWPKDGNVISICISQPDCRGAFKSTFVFNKHLVFSYLYSCWSFSCSESLSEFQAQAAESQVQAAIFIRYLPCVRASAASTPITVISFYLASHTHIKARRLLRAANECDA